MVEGGSVKGLVKTYYPSKSFSSPMTQCNILHPHAKASHRAKPKVSGVGQYTLPS